MKRDLWRMLYGYVLLVVVASLAMVFGLGKVEEKTSYGLLPLLVLLALWGDRWASWAFPKRDEESKGNKDEMPEC